MPTETLQLESIDALPAVFTDVTDVLREADHTPVLEQYLVTLEQAHLGFFAGQHDPLGEAWAALAPSTVRAKGRDTILVETGHLRASLGERGDGAIREAFKEGSDGQHSLVFGTSDPRALFHMEGTANMPARPPVGLNDQLLDLLTESLADSAVEALLK